ncbi:lipoprotein [Halomonas sp. HP20-15]|nr:lipoprotein [Halomonas sp. HP20-15]MDW5376124.1 lipoprotein [Halomonas sp. HP20-15]
MSAFRIAALAIALAALSGCGQKGPLYMPGDEQAAEQYDPADVYPEESEAQPQPSQTEGAADSADDDATTNGNATTRGAGE